MKTWAWSVAVAAVLFAHATRAETVKGDGGFAIDVDTKGACVLVPAERRSEAACAGIDAIPTKLAPIDGDARYTFLASLPLETSGRFWFGVIHVAAADADGLTAARLARLKSSLQSLTGTLGDFNVSAANASDVASGDGTDAVRILFDATSVSDATKRYASAFVVYSGVDEYVIQTFNDAAQAKAVAERTDAALATRTLAGRPPTLGLAKVMPVVRSVMTFGALAVVAFLVVREAIKTRARKPKRDPKTVDLTRYVRAHRLGDLAAVTSFASALIQWLAVLGDSRSTQAVFRVLGFTIAWAAVAPLLLWVHRVVRNAHALGCSAVPTPTSAVTWFFVPAASAFMPFRVLCDVAGAVRRRSERMATVWLIAAWWLTWIVGIAARLASVTVLASIFTAISSLAFWAAATSLDRDQERLRRKLAAKAR